jgi:hypothetical protein
MTVLQQTVLPGNKISSMVSVRKIYDFCGGKFRENGIRHFCFNPITEPGFILVQVNIFEPTKQTIA